MMFQKYLLLCVSIVFLSEYSFGMENKSLLNKIKNGYIEVKNSVSENKKEVALKTVGIGCFGFGVGLLKLSVKEENKDTKLVEIVKNNSEFLTGASAVGIISGFVWGVHSSAKKSTSKKMIEQRILELENDIQEMENDLNLQNPEKLIEIKVLKRLLEKEKRKLEELE